MTIVMHSLIDEDRHIKGQADSVPEFRVKVSRERAAENRDRVIAVAGRLLRERGVDGIGVDALMRAAGLTHGGFYKTFASKEALVGEACDRVMADSANKWAASAEGTSEDKLARFVRDYLSPGHCAAIGDGCVFAALATDAGRRQGPLRRAFTNGLGAAIERLARLFPGRAAARRERALATLASLVGAIVLARATDDEALRTDMFSATATLVLKAWPPDFERSGRYTA